MSNHENTPVHLGDQSNTAPQVIAGCSRQSGKAVLKDAIHHLRMRANQLQTLVDMLPENPTREQDAALLGIALGIERH